MISQHYKNFKVRDYMDNCDLENQISNSMIDCSLGTNPFIDKSMKSINILLYNINY